MTSQPSGFQGAPVPDSPWATGSGLGEPVSLDLPPAPAPYTPGPEPIVDTAVADYTAGQTPIYAPGPAVADGYVPPAATPGYTPYQATPESNAGTPAYAGYTPAPQPAPYTPAIPGYTPATPGYSPAASYVQPPYQTPGATWQPETSSPYLASQQQYLPTPYAPAPIQAYQVPDPLAKSQVAAGVLGIFLGSLGIHNFYLGKTGRAVAQLLITLLTFGVGAVVTGIWGLIEGILILCAQPGSIWSVDGNGRPLNR